MTYLDGEEPQAHYPGGDELEAKGNAPDERAGLDVKSHTVYSISSQHNFSSPPTCKGKTPTVYEIRDTHTNGDHNLEQPRDATTHLLRRALRNIRGRDGGKRANAETADDAPRVDVREPVFTASDGGEDLEDG
jgi:hypothetical protein